MQPQSTEDAEHPIVPVIMKRKPDIRFFMANFESPLISHEQIFSTIHFDHFGHME